MDLAIIGLWIAILFATVVIFAWKPKGGDDFPNDDRYSSSGAGE